MKITKKLELTTRDISIVSVSDCDCFNDRPLLKLTPVAPLLRGLLFTLRPITTIVFGVNAARLVTSIGPNESIETIKTTEVTDPCDYVFTYALEELDENTAAVVTKDILKAKKIIVRSLIKDEGQLYHPEFK